MLRVTLAGATGWVGKPLVEAISEADDLQLVAAVARRSAGESIGGVRISASISEALQTPSDVFVDYTSAASVRANVLAAIEAKRHVVIGSSGLTADDFDEIRTRAESAGVGVVAVGNFAITAALLQRFAVEAAKYLDSWEIIDSAYAGKMDAPSGMARELAWRLSELQRPAVQVPIEKTVGQVEARGANVNDSRIHSVRLPGYTIGLEVRFGQHDERLTLQYDAGPGAAPYIGGTLLAIRRAPQVKGLVRGLDRIL
ncbi:MAG TPA: 4-hydroxy-tetrahydrodipicolinate reductase [Thermoanaerobaculia bacterium]|nr:4-hydroxy-tetrahydrodipicolinate reductase [Thermoanaerobaculia bacterium]